MSISKKIKTLKNLQKILSKKRKNKKKIVLCHGVFDLLHIGHIKHFKEAKSKGDILVVTVTPDKFVSKGPNRPIFPLNTRMEAISELDCVDFVAPNITPNAIKPIINLKPHFYCKGQEYKKSSNDSTGLIKQEIKTIQKVGGKIFYTGGEVHSSSKIINDTSLNLTYDQKKFLDSVKTQNTLCQNNNINKIIESFSNLKVLVIGEAIIDEYIYCEALGKSGKEPVLVLRDLFKERYLGGSAAIAKNISSFSKKVTLLSYVGEKNEEKNFLSKNLPSNINSYFLKKKNSPTIIKKRFVEDINKRKILGVYSLNDQSLSNKEQKLFQKKIIQEIKRHDLVIVSDYGHGLISKETAKLIIKKSKFLAVNTQLNASNAGFHVISKYNKANLILINETELRQEFRNKVDNVDILIKQLSKKVKSNYSVVTCGKHGSKIFSLKNRKIITCPAFANNVTDKIGTGDTMLALLSLAMYKKIDTKFCMLLSALGAAYNIEHMANSVSLSKSSIIKAMQSYLK